MPWYRKNDGKGTYYACIRGSKDAPPACRAGALPSDDDRNGDQCGRMSAKLCDAPVGTSSCDMPICEKHATHVPGRDLDYCPRHAHLARPQHATGFPSIGTRFGSSAGR